MCYVDFSSDSNYNKIMLDYEEFCNSLDKVSIANFGTPVQRLLKQTLYDYFHNEEKEIFDIVLDEILKTNQHISYFNMYSKFLRYRKREKTVIPDEAELTIANSCDHKECHLCDVDVCNVIRETFLEEWKNIDHPFKDKRRIEAKKRIKEVFPNLKWDFKLTKEFRIDVQGKMTRVMIDIKEEDIENVN